MAQETLLHVAQRRQQVGRLCWRLSLTSPSEQVRRSKFGEELKPGFHPVFLVYEFPIAALTNYHKLSGWKRQKCIILQSCRSELSLTELAVLTELKSRYRQGCGPFWSLHRRVHLLVFSTFETAHIPSSWSSSDIFKTSKVTSLWPFIVTTSLSDHSQERFSVFKNPRLDRLPWVTQDSLPPTRCVPFIMSAKSLLLCEVHGFQDWGQGHVRGVLFLPTTPGGGDGSGDGPDQARPFRGLPWEFFSLKLTREFSLSLWSYNNVSHCLQRSYFLPHGKNRFWKIK